jgi:hypothetical protein
MATPTNLPAAQTSGAVLTAAYMNDIRGAFRILQVVTGTQSAGTSNTTTTYAATGLNASITPQSNTSKILVLVQQNGCYKSSGTNNALNLKLQRGTTDIVSNIYIGLSASIDLFLGSQTFVYLDSPATTSSTNYRTVLAANASPGTVITEYGSLLSNIVLMEVSA